MLPETLRSVSGMLENVELFESLVKGSSELLRRALRLNEWVVEREDELPLIVRYAHVIFCFRTAKEELDQLLDMARRAMDGETVGLNELQSALRHFLIDLDSALDYLQAFVGKLLAKMPRDVSKKWQEHLRAARNEVVHDKAPLVRLQTSGGTVCHADVASSVSGVSYIEFQLRRSADGRVMWYSPWDLETALLNPVKSLLERVTEHVILLLGKSG